ncbi:MAG: HAD-IA family hydrolase [Bacillota bacterium]
MRFSLLLADVDDTLLEFHSAERAAYAAVSARFLIPDDEELFLLYQAINRRQWEKFSRGETTQAKLRLDRFQDFTDALGLTDTDVQAMSDLFVKALGEQHIPVSGAQAFLRRICAQMPVCLVTNGFAAVQRARLLRSPLRRYIKDILISEEFQNAKPHPEMLLEAMKRMQITDPRQAVMIGDNEDSDILAAKNAGVQSILFLNGAPPPKQTNADFVAATLSEAGEWIAGQQT